MPSKLCSRSHQEKCQNQPLLQNTGVRRWRIKKVSKLVIGTRFAELATYATSPGQATIGKGNSRHGYLSQ